MEPLVAAVRGDRLPVILVAAWALGEIGDVRAIDPLIEKVARTTYDDDLGRAVAKALERLTFYQVSLEIL